MEIDFEGLDKFSETAEASIKSINLNYNSSWDDSVHDSFNNFISEFQSKANEMNEIMKSFVQVVQPLQQIKIDELRQQYEELISNIQ